MSRKVKCKNIQTESTTDNLITHKNNFKVQKYLFFIRTYKNKHNKLILTCSKLANKMIYESSS